MDERPEGTWRDERALPLSELTRATAANAQEGQVDDAAPGDPDSTSAAGRLRPSPDGATPSGRGAPH
ncbi:hypothetical protein [Krasilnikovia sp. M28-CT-15]|uniref:hypothetical protein n=1 Tax=Krasilnikovia sp. M28-CT-15 TaxID=3373540 RepID=UPI00387786F9